MKRSRPPLTEKQIEFRAAIINSRVKPVSKTVEIPPEKTEHEEFLAGKITYLKNCIFWIDEYIKGEEGKERLLESITAIEQHCREIKEKFK